MPTANDIRRQFIEFFEKKHGHTFVPSSSVVPYDDPTLLFTNAGMNQFKPIFLGTETRPYQRAVNSQKCIRAGGKHNDLDDVGKDTYHHTFFEMLGNWSFGDYYKREAIQWAWELLTKEWGMDNSRLHATVFGGDKEFGLDPDDEAATLWTQATDIDPSHVHRFGKKDNFWMMGDTGPCGPCSEIHYDRTLDKSGGPLVNKGDARVIEIWNLVFIQYNRDESGKLTPLPAKHVDTGMGFERVTAVLQGKDSNYDTDVFTPIMDAIGKLVSKNYGGKLDDLNDVAFRVIADHLRMLTFSITDGALPSNKGRGAVVRSVLRRAVRFGYQCFGQREPLIYKLVPALVAHMGGAYPELKSNPKRVQDVIRGEEEDFLRTVGRGIGLFNQALENARSQFEMASIRPYPAGPASAKVLTPAQKEYERKYPRETNPRPVISDDVMFTLVTQDGFPVDLIRQMAQERNYGVAEKGFQRLMDEHVRKSRGKEAERQTALNITGGLPTTDDTFKWAGPTCDGTVIGWIADNQVQTKGQLPAETEVGLLLERSCFYAEQGGQVGDQGTVRTPTGLFEVSKTAKVGSAVVHVGQVTEGRMEIGQTAQLAVSAEREFTRKNHTATHLLNWALRKVLGDHVEQKGSLVDPNKTRFDFAHPTPLTADLIAEVERLVNEKVYADLPVTAVTVPLAEAKKIPGVRAVFGEKYPDPVRVVLIGDDPLEGVTPDDSVEFCGGTHLTRTGQTGPFKIVSQEAVGKGARRVTAITGREAVAMIQGMTAVVDLLTARLNCKLMELPERVETLQDEIKKLQQQLNKGAASDLQGAADKLLAEAAEVKGAKVIVGEMPAGPDEPMRQQVDRLRQKAGSAVVVLGWADDGKVGLLAAVTADLVKKGLHAGKLIGQVAKVVGGNGGGNPTMAQAGGKEPAKLAEALQLAKKLASEQLAQ